METKRSRERLSPAEHEVIDRDVAIEFEFEGRQVALLVGPDQPGRHALHGDLARPRGRRHMKIDAAREVEDALDRRGNVKLHLNRLTGRHELYDLEHDPGEQHDIAPRWMALAKELLAELSRFEDTQRLEAPVSDLSPEEREALERLGYGS